MKGFTHNLSKNCWPKNPLYLKPHRIVLVLITLLGIGLPVYSGSGAVIIQPTVHAFVRNGESFNSGKVQIFKDGTDDRATLEYDISELSTAVQSATLIFSRSDAPVVSEVFPRSYDFFGYAGDGLLSLVDYSAGSKIASNISYDGSAEFSVDVTAFVNDQIAASSDWAGFSGRQQADLFGDAEFGVGGNYPTLKLGPVPEPRAFALVSASVLCCIVIYRRLIDTYFR